MRIQDSQAGEENCAKGQSASRTREKRHLRELGVTGGRRDYLVSDDLLLFARGVGHILPKLNSGVRAACLQKNGNSGDLPIAGHSFKAKRQRSSLGVAAVPSDQCATGIMNSVIGSGAP